MKLKELRKIKHLSQEDVGKFLGTSKQTISNWESGGSEPDITAIIKLAQFFNVTTDYLLGLVNEKDLSKIRTSISNLDRNRLIEIINQLLDLILNDETTRKTMKIYKIINNVDKDAICDQMNQLSKLGYQFESMAICFAPINQDQEKAARYFIHILMSIAIDNT